MRKALSLLKNRVFLVFIIFFLSSATNYAARYRLPSSLTAITGGGAVCLNAAVSLSSDMTSASCGASGGTSDIAITINWYSNTINSVSGATLVSGPIASNSSASVVTYNYSPATSSAGTLYYFYTVTWADPDGASACTGGTLTSAITSVTVTASPDAVIVSGGGTVCGSTTLTASGGAGGTIYWQNTTSNGTSTATASSSQLVSTSGTYYFRSYSGGCWGTQGSAVVTVNPAPGTPVFSLGTSSSRCSGAGTVTYSATSSNSTGITYSLDAASLAGGNTINAATGEVTYSASWSGSAIITATASGCGTAASNHTVSITGIPGTYSVGPTGNFASIGAALTGISACPINGAYILELQASYVSSVETFPISITNYSGLSSSNTITIRPSAAATNLTITGSSSTYLFNFNATHYITIDGRSGGTGTTKNLTISNTNTSGSTIHFINDAQYNTIQYCNLQGVSTSSTTGVIEFSTSSTTGGNSYNTISNCNISGGATTVRQGIYSSGTTTAGRLNANNTIINSNIFNFFSTSESNGIYMGAGTTDWTVSGCSFYQTANRTSSGSSRWSAMYVDNNTNGNNFQFLNNYIGGTAANCGGTAMTIAEGAISAFKIKSNASAGTPVIIQGNTISNIAFSTASTSVNPLIYHIDGPITIHNNTIGSQSTTNSITFSSPTAFTPPSTGPTMSGIMAGGALVSGSAETTIGGIVSITNNNIGGFSLSATGSGSAEFRGIDFGQVRHNFTITGNTIGSPTTANSVNNSAPQAIFGILGFADKTAVHTVANNIVANLTCTNTGSNTEQRVVGIQAQGSAAGGIYDVYGNTVYNLSSATTNVGRAVAAGIRAVNNATVSDGTLVHDNLVYNLTNTNTGSLANLALGIEFLGPATANNKVYNNRVYQVSLSTTGAGRIYGIYMSNGTAAVYNNSVSLGYNSAGAALTSPYNICGISEMNAATGNSYYFNTVAVAGTGVTGTANTYAFYSSLTATKTMMNNIFYNSRSNGAGTGKHYAYGIPSTGATSEHNVIAASGTGGVFGVFGTTDYTDLSTWTAASGLDVYSEQENPVFVSITDLKLQPVQDNWIINNAGTPVSGYTTDIDAETRNTLMPDPGFDEVKIDGSWIGPTSTDWLTTSNWETGVIPTNLHNVSVRKANYFPVVATTQALKHLLIKGISALVTINGGTIQVGGNFLLRPTAKIDAINGSLELTGTSAAQNICGNYFINKTVKNLTISNSTGVNISSTGDTLKIAGLLKFGNVNSSVLSTGNNLTLLSTASATASVGDLTNAGANSGNSITGNATVERYISAARKWRFLSVPTNTNQTINQAWQENNAAGVTGASGYGMHVTDNRSNWASNGFDFYSPAGPSVKVWNTSTLAWEGVSGSTQNVKNIGGYMCYVRGDRTATPSNSTLTSTVLRTTGTLYQNDQATINVGIGQFVPVGNPYASSIDVRNLAKSNVQDFFYLWDPMLGGSYGLGAYQLLSKSGADYVITPGGGSYGASGAVTNFIQSGSAFFVRGAGSAGTVNFQENAKNPASSMVYFTEANPQQMRINLMIPQADSALIADGVFVNFGDQYTSQVDYDDALKYPNGNENVSIKTENKLLMLERRHSIQSNDTMFLNLTGVRAQNYRWSLNLENMDAPGRTGYLIDHFTQTSTELNLAGTTIYDFSIQNIPGSYAADRFKVVFNQLTVVPVSFTSISAIRNTDKTADIRWSTASEINISSYLIQKSSDGINFSDMSSTSASANNGSTANYIAKDMNPFSADNFYRIKAISQDGRIQYSPIAKLAPLKSIPSISVYPNPVEDKQMNVKFAGQKAGEYKLELTNKIGQVIYRNTISIHSDNETRSFNLGSNVLPGSYQLKLMTNDHSSNVIQVLIR